MCHDLLCALSLVLNVLADYSIRTHPKSQANHQAEYCLAEELPDGTKSVLRDMHLDVIIGKTKGSKPNRSEEHQEHIDIAKSAQKQAGNECGNYDDDASHSGNALLLHTIRIDAGISLFLADIVLPHPSDEIFAKPHGNNEAQDQGENCSEGDVVPKIGS